MLIFDGIPEEAIKPAEYCNHGSGSVCRLYRCKCKAIDVADVRKCSGFIPSDLMDEYWKNQKTLGEF